MPVSGSRNLKTFPSAYSQPQLVNTVGFVSDTKPHRAFQPELEIPHLEGIPHAILDPHLVVLTQRGDRRRRQPISALPQLSPCCGTRPISTPLTSTGLFL